jgi:hypothetical protein
MKILLTIILLTLPISAFADMECKEAANNISAMTDDVMVCRDEKVTCYVYMGYYKSGMDCLPNNIL